MSSEKALEDTIRAGQAAREIVIAQQKRVAIEERDELAAANMRQQKRLVKSSTTANSTETLVGSVQSLVVATLSPSNSAQNKKLKGGLKNTLLVE